MVNKEKTMEKLIYVAAFYGKTIVVSNQNKIVDAIISHDEVPQEVKNALKSFLNHCVDTSYDDMRHVMNTAFMFTISLINLSSILGGVTEAYTYMQSIIEKRDISKLLGVANLTISKDTNFKSFEEELSNDLIVDITERYMEKYMK